MQTAWNDNELIITTVRKEGKIPTTTNVAINNASVNEEP